MYDYRAQVLRVIDGDTVELRLDLGLHIYVNEVCRLEGIDAPELNTEEGRAAKAALTLMVWEQGPWFRVFTVKANERDKYGRFLATIYPANKDGAAQDALVSLQQQMINTGHGRFYDGGKR